VLGAPDGLAVCQNGIGISEAFSDSVNSDLAPDDAVARIDVVVSYGLNALGGAVVLTMKNRSDDAASVAIAIKRLPFHQLSGAPDVGCGIRATSWALAFTGRHFRTTH
jgi:hypothetical protein